MLLILTNSLDGTVDFLMEHLKQESVFRFNIDLWADYEIQIHADNFWIKDPTGRFIDEQMVSSCYYRKPRFDLIATVPKGGSLENWLKSSGHISPESSGISAVSKVRLDW